MQLKMQLFCLIFRARPCSSDASGSNNARSASLGGSPLRIRLRWPIPLSIEPEHEPYGKLLREIELDELPVDELVAQEAHAKAELLEIPDVLCGQRTMLKSFVDYLGKVNK